MKVSFMSDDEYVIITISVISLDCLDNFSL
jgi:hypothetical protein